MFLAGVPSPPCAVGIKEIDGEKLSANILAIFILFSRDEQTSSLQLQSVKNVDYFSVVCCGHAGDRGVTLNGGYCFGEAPQIEQTLRFNFPCPSETGLFSSFHIGNVSVRHRDNIIMFSRPAALRASLLIFLFEQNTYYFVNFSKKMYGIFVRV